MDENRQSRKSASKDLFRLASLGALAALVKKPFLLPQDVIIPVKGASSGRAYSSSSCKISFSSTNGTFKLI